jgi:hypothetical protein
VLASSPPSPPFNWDNAPHVDLSLLDTVKEVGNTFDELLEMAIEESNEYFRNFEDFDFQGLRDSSCEEFSYQDDASTYYNVEEEFPVEAISCTPQLLHAHGEKS